MMRLKNYRVDFKQKKNEISSSKSLGTTMALLKKWFIKEKNTANSSKNIDFFQNY